MRYVDLFCGAGGTSCGFTRAGWECIGAADWDQNALNTYQLNFPSHPAVRADLSEALDDSLVESWRASLHEDGLLAASSPCTDFSTANNKPSGRAAQLTAKLAEHIGRIRPAWVSFENVPNAVKSDQFASLLRSLEEQGYSVKHGVVSALDAGLPQRRRRLFLVASRYHNVEVVWAHFLSTLNMPASTMRETFTYAGLDCPKPFVYFHSCHERLRKSIHAVDGIGPTVRTVLRPFRASYPFTSRDDCSDRDEIFAANTQHMSAMQGFPADYKWSGSKTNVARCIGNAVPPPLAERMARAITSAVSTPFCTPGSSPHPSNTGGS